MYLSWFCFEDAGDLASVIIGRGARTRRGLRPTIRRIRRAPSGVRSARAHCASSARTAARASSVDFLHSSSQFPEGFDLFDDAGDARRWVVARELQKKYSASPALTDWTSAAAAIATPSATPSAAPSAATMSATPSATSSATSDLGELLKTFDFDESSDADVLACEQAVFKTLRREAGDLLGSKMTASLATLCILKHASLPEAVATMLSNKLHPPLPGSFVGASTVGGALAEAATAEEALRSTMARVLSGAAVRRSVVSDLVKVLVVDPAAEGLLQPMLFFKGFHALATHRVAHSLWLDGSVASRGAALMLQSRASELFGVDIHPGATIGNGVMLDHASGVVIGATAIVGSDVYMLHGVTLGATGKPTFGAKRHPTIGSSVILGAGAVVLGDITVADGCTVGAGAIVTKDVPPGSTVVGINKLLERPVMMNEQPRKADDGDEPSATARKPAGPQASRSGTNADDYTWLYSI